MKPWSPAVYSVIILICSLSSVKGDDIPVECGFAVVNNIYTCQLIGVTIDADEYSNFVIGGEHLPGRTNDDVLRITILSSNIKFIIPQLFEALPNVRDFFISNGALERIQSKAFTFASNLRLILITGNPAIKEIQDSAFYGASNLFILDLFANDIASIHERAFHGLDSLAQVFLEDNHLKELHANLLRPLKNLEVLFLENNHLEVLDGRFLEANAQITSMSISENQINAIGKGFLDNLERLQFLSARGNKCVDSSWAIGGETTIDTVREDLTKCFENFQVPEVPDGEVRRFIIEVRGPFALYYEDGTEIIRI